MYKFCKKQRAYTRKVDRRLGGESAGQHPPNREIVSFRSCVRACCRMSGHFGMKMLTVVRFIFYLLARGLLSFILGDHYLLSPENDSEKVKAKERERETETEKERIGERRKKVKRERERERAKER